MEIFISTHSFFSLNFLNFLGIPSNTETRIVFHSGITVNNDGQFLTNGGRVLIVVCLGNDLKLAAAEATKVCQGIKFSGKGAQFRTDIAKKAFKL